MTTLEDAAEALNHRVSELAGDPDADGVFLDRDGIVALANEFDLRIDHLSTAGMGVVQGMIGATRSGLVEDFPAMLFGVWLNGLLTGLLLEKLRNA